MDSEVRYEAYEVAKNMSSMKAQCILCSESVRRRLYYPTDVQPYTRRVLECVGLCY